MEEDAYKGLLEYVLLQRNIQLWRAVYNAYAQDPAYTHKNWDVLNTRALRMIQEGTFSAHVEKRYKTNYR